MPTHLTLTLLRSSRGWTQRELAQAARASSNVLSGYETGFRPLSLRKLEDLSSAMGYGPAAVDVALLGVENLLAAMAPPPAGSLVNPTEAEWQRIQRAAAAAAREAAEKTCEVLAEAVRAARAREERREAGEQWERLRRLSHRERRALVESERDFQNWALCERLCAESEKAAADEASRALELAELALRVAQLVPGEEEARSLIQGYAWAFLGNARRVASKLPEAEEAFKKSRLLRQTGADSNPGLLDRVRLLDLEASLRCDQRRFSEALELHESALSMSTQPASLYILLNKAATQEQMGAVEGAVETLERAAVLLGEESEPRLRCVLRFNLIVNLVHLGRHDEAAALLPEMRNLAVRLGNGLDLVRALWLESRVLAGLGRREKAVAALEQVRGEFTSREIAYDAALVSLELAVLYLEDGRTSEVRILARQMLWIFRAQGVHREALAALKLFCEAAEREQATVDLARRVAEYLERARHNPDLRFE
ncbi:MAG TPA: helix-turn-helix domain-containing protein [Thermoanaerobaculia bacterium]|nr:helix-turn-helix domain-containing protein [Thermoanaerobaculia bacterium]